MKQDNCKHRQGLSGDDYVYYAQVFANTGDFLPSAWLDWRGSAAIGWAID
jgi:hypothetical protein